MTTTGKIDSDHTDTNTTTNTNDNNNEEAYTLTNNNHIYDTIIIGAGPSGLAVAARLREPTPSALFTEEEHRRYLWIRKNRGRTNVVLVKKKKMMTKEKVGFGASSSSPLHHDIQSDHRDQHHHHRCHHYHDTLVLDSSSTEWLSEWHRLFKVLDIAYLRSPAFFHVDPGDRDGLLEFASVDAHQTTGEKRPVEGELREIKGCVGKEISKHSKKKKRVTKEKESKMGSGGGKSATPEVAIDERDRKDYYTPSTKLFARHCDCVIDRYSLRRDIIKRETVQDIRFGTLSSALATTNNEEDSRVFTLHTNDGVHYARTVVLAIGSGCLTGSSPMNCSFGDVFSMTAESQQPDRASIPNVCHSHDIQDFPSSTVQEKIRIGEHTSVLVIGGGLTSAQLVDLAIKKGVSHVSLLTRSELKTKPFDVDLAWMGKYKNHEKSVFWSADTDEERLAMIQSARGGGSITSHYAKILASHQQSGRLSIYERTSLKSCVYSQSTGLSAVETEPCNTKLHTTQFDYIYLATGTPSDFTNLPFLQTLLKEFPLHSHGGLPCLTDELAWNATVPLFVTGRLAGLRLGPGAGNLEGARTGAERVAWGIEEWLEHHTANKHDARRNGADLVDKYVQGVGSRFESLSMEGLVS